MVRRFMTRKSDKLTTLVNVWQKKNSMENCNIYSKDILKPFKGTLFFENIPSSLTSYKIVLA